MKSLLLSCRNFESKIKKLANRPDDIEPEPIKEKEYKADKSIVCLICVENGDALEKVSDDLSKEIKKFTEDTKTKKVVLLPFGHLSNNLASSQETKDCLNNLENKLKNLDIVRVHFGSHKSLLLDIFGHVGNVRFREF